MIILSIIHNIFNPQKDIVVKQIRIYLLKFNTIRLCRYPYAAAPRGYPAGTRLTIHPPIDRMLTFQNVSETVAELTLPCFSSYNKIVM